MNDDIKRKIQDAIDESRVVVFMKGTKRFPQCGFSSRVVEILKQHGADFSDFNVLTNPAVRQGIKDFSNWPTIPQVYVDGKFVGGCDIVIDMAQSGELAKLLADAKAS